MKKTTLRWLGFSIVVLVLVIAIGAIKLYNDFFPKAESIQFPDIEKITVIEISKNDLHIKYTDNETIKVIAECFLNAKATRILSVHDVPTVKEYYIVNFIEEDSSRIYTSFIYQENSKWYIEQPYWGVYEIDKDILSFIEDEA
ncbi:DUF5301 domain-containing protein [Clostridiaceae bacterium M8S5]|nr:DUF5301 domain-containing protein [Clostridiaceae bacterium M8S5]